MFTFSARTRARVRFSLGTNVNTQEFGHSACARVQGLHLLPTRALDGISAIGVPSV